YLKMVVYFLTTGLHLLTLPRGSVAEIPNKPSGTVTDLSSTKSAPGDHQIFPDAVKPDLPVFAMNYPRIQVPFEITLWVLLASFARIGFHIYHKVPFWVPEPCLLISIGLMLGAIMHAVHEEPPAMLSYDLFFLYILPPMVLDSGYFMPTRPFFENIGTVLWFAVVGTLWNSIGVGMSLYGVCQIGALEVQDINLQENLLFASIISAVDPVAVLSVFEDVSVNEQLYIVVFGESLFSDAVTVVLYNMFTFVAEMPEVEPVNLFLGVAKFFVVDLGGLAFGLVFGFVASFTTRFTSKVREIEPLFIFMYSYLAYLVAELFNISSIMAIVTCALTMKYYVEENVTQRSCTTIRHVVKMLSSISETLIFFFLGVVTITTEHEWNWGYILFTLLFAFLWRGLGILVLTQIINPFRTIPFNFKDQFMLGYSGLRGAVAFALVFTLPDHIGRNKPFVSTTICLILFTVFIQGISIRPLMEFINVRRTNRNLDTINVEVHSRLMEHAIAGIEDICGQWGHYYWKDKFMKFDNQFLRHILIKDNRAESSIVALYKKLELQSAMEILDIVSGDTSTAPSVISLCRGKGSGKPKRRFADLGSMHDILSKNMYKIRQQTTEYTTKHSLPNDSHTKEILIRRHSSIRHSFGQGSSLGPYFSLPTGSLDRTQSLGHTDNGEDETLSGGGYPSAPRSRISQSSRSSSRISLPLRRLDTLTEVSSSAGVDLVDERSGGRGRGRAGGRGKSRLNSSSSDSRVPAPPCHFDSSEVFHGNRDSMPEQEEPLSLSVTWVESSDHDDSSTQNPLLRRPRWNPVKPKNP
uniref:Sodium/hydrogen exchanger n=1 Tax=Esox lucius TaxID=8010 RepID=A0A6Q2ZL34_ESOLU